MHVDPDETGFLIFEHSVLIPPPFNGLISIPENLRLSHGAAVLQWRPATTLYRAVPVMFFQRISVMGMREESQFEYEFFRVLLSVSS